MNAAVEPTIYFKHPDDKTSELPLSTAPVLVGKEFAGDWWRIDEERVDEFERSTYLDALPFPWSDEAFPSRLVEGFHLLGLLDYMLNAILRVRGPRSYGVNYGFDHVRFVSPVMLDDTIRLVGTVDEVRPKGSGFLIRQHCVVEVEGRDRPACVADWWVYWLTEPPFEG